MWRRRIRDRHGAPSFTQWAVPTGVRAFRRIPKTGRIHAWSSDSALDAADPSTTKGHCKVYIISILYNTSEPTYSSTVILNIIARHRHRDFPRFLTRRSNAVRLPFQVISSNYAHRIHCILRYDIYIILYHIVYIVLYRIYYIFKNRMYLFMYLLKSTKFS